MVQSPIGSLFALGFLITLLLLPLPPTHMVSDSFSRFSDAHWLWSGADPQGQLPGVGGVHHHWFGLGQTLLLAFPDFVLAQMGVPI